MEGEYLVFGIAHGRLEIFMYAVRVYERLARRKYYWGTPDDITFSDCHSSFSTLLNQILASGYVWDAKDHYSSMLFTLPDHQTIKKSHCVDNLQRST